MPNETGIVVDSVQVLLTNALQDGGIIADNEVPEQVQLTRALRQANWLLAQWQRNRYLIYHLVDYAIPSTGKQSYTVGAGGDVNINPRPDRLESAFLRILPSQTTTNVNVDLPLHIIPSMEDYNRIAIKNLGINSAGAGGTIAWRIFYDPVWPVGILRPWPIPQATIYEIHVTFKETLARFNSVQQAINLPPEYEVALNWCLAEVFREAWQLPPSETVTKLARRALNAIRLANVAVPTLTMPSAVRNRGRAYDYHGSDEV